MHVLRILPSDRRSWGDLRQNEEAVAATRAGHESGKLRAEMSAQLAASASKTSWSGGQRGCCVGGPLPVRRRRRSGGNNAGMRATLTAVLSSGGRAELAHVGDSRAFRLCGGRFRPVIEDHTIGKPRRDADLLAPVLAWHLDGRSDSPLVSACGTCGPATVTCGAPANSARS